MNQEKLDRKLDRIIDALEKIAQSLSEMNVEGIEIYGESK